MLKWSRFLQPLLGPWDPPAERGGSCVGRAWVGWLEVVGGGGSQWDEP